MDEQNRIQDFLRHAKRRSLAALLWRQAVIAAGAGLAGLILLLFLGTDILEWYWLLILLAGSFLVGLYRVLGGLPSDYRLARQVDRRLALKDCLSTACYFALPESNGRGSSQLRELVFERAAQLCRTIAPQSAVPIRAPRWGYSTVALALVALAMFGLRYGMEGRLDLRPPLVRSVAGLFRPIWQMAAFRKPAAKPAPEPPPRTGLALDQQTARLADPAVPQDGQWLPEERSDSKRGLSPGRRPDEESGSNEAQTQGMDSSMLEKMRDAFKDMMAKLGVDVETFDSDKKGTRAAKQGSSRGPTSVAEGEMMPGRSAAPSDKAGDQKGPGGGNAEAAKGQPNPPDAKQGRSNDERDGIGTSEGAKEIRNAEQLAAMGKISELFGKRQANLTGEVMVEVSSSDRQRLRTEYSESAAAHSEQGGEIHRDEVPLLYQSYVQRYFEQVRQAAPAPEPAQP